MHFQVQDIKTFHTNKQISLSWILRGKRLDYQGKISLERYRNLNFLLQFALHSILHFIHYLAQCFTCLNFLTSSLFPRSFSMLTLLYMHLFRYAFYLFFYEQFSFFVLPLPPLVLFLSHLKSQSCSQKGFKYRGSCTENHISFFSFPLHLDPCVKLLRLTTALWNFFFSVALSRCFPCLFRCTIDVLVRYGKSPRRCGKCMHKSSQEAKLINHS